MKFKIVPISKNVACLESADEGTALCNFATCMDTDMSAYFKAVPISDEEHEFLQKEGLEID